MGKKSRTTFYQKQRRQLNRYMSQARKLKRIDTMERRIGELVQIEHMYDRAVQQLTKEAMRKLREQQRREARKYTDKRFKELKKQGLPKNEIYKKIAKELENMFGVKVSASEVKEYLESRRK